MATTSSSKTTTRAAFSLTLEIGGEPIPLTSQEISKTFDQTSNASTASSSSSSSNPLDGVISKGLSFSTPGGWHLNIALSKLESWLSEKGFDLPEFMEKLIDDTLITINHVMVDSNGNFSFSLSVEFTPPLGSSLTNGIFAIEDVGIAISHKSDPTTSKPSS